MTLLDDIEKQHEDYSDLAKEVMQEDVIRRRAGKHDPPVLAALINDSCITLRESVIDLCEENPMVPVGLILTAAIGSLLENFFRMGMLAQERGLIPIECDCPSHGGGQPDVS